MLQHIRFAAHHSECNGDAEARVMAFKRALEKCSTKGRSVKQYSANLLLPYQTTPQSTSSEMPRELFLKR